MLGFGQQQLVEQRPVLLYSLKKFIFKIMLKKSRRAHLCIGTPENIILVQIIHVYHLDLVLFNFLLVLLDEALFS